MIAKRKAVRGFHTLTAIKNTHSKNTMNTIKNIAACARQICAASRFSVNPSTGMGKLESTLKRAVLKFSPVLENTIGIAGNPPDSGIFSRSKFIGTGFSVSHGFGRDGWCGNARRMAIPMFSTSRPPVALENAACGLQSRIGAETMTTVNTPTTSRPDTNARQQAIESALESALHFIRTDHPGYSLCLATARARRALSLLKQACADAAKNGSAA